MTIQQDRITDLQHDISWAKVELHRAQDEHQNWKPTAFDYEDKIDEMIDKKYPIPETAMVEFNVHGYTVTQIMRKLNAESLDRFREEFFQEHYDQITGDDANERASNVADAERALARLEEELVDALDKLNKSED